MIQFGQNVCPHDADNDSSLEAFLHMPQNFALHARDSTFSLFVNIMRKDFRLLVWMDGNVCVCLSVSIAERHFCVYAFVNYVHDMTINSMHVQT
jgi:hypothetical protein